MKITYCILIVLMGLGFTSCLDDFTSVNQDPDKIYSDNMTPEAIFPGTVYKTLNAMARLNHDYFCWQSYYCRMSKSFSENDDPGDRLFTFYTQILKDLKMLEDTYVGREEYNNVGGIVLTWKSFIYSYLVSIWGALPMEEALSVTEKNKYHYDAEEKIYMQVLRDLQKAVNMFNPNTKVETDKLSVDPFYPKNDKSSDIEKWRKFANTLRLEVAVRMMNLKDEQVRQFAKRQIEEALNAKNRNYFISSVADIARGRWGTDLNSDASYYYLRIQRGHDENTNNGYSQHPAIGQYLYLYLRSFNDPRLQKYAKRAEGDKRFFVTDTLKDETGKRVDVRYRIPYAVYKEFQAIPQTQYVGRLSETTTSTYKDPHGQSYMPLVDEGENWAWIHPDFLRQDGTITFMNWADACFLLAEVSLRINEWNLNIAALPRTAEAYYYDGIQASFAEYGIATGYDDYISQNGIKWGTDSDDEKCLREYRGYFRAHIYGESGGQTYRGDPKSRDSFLNPRTYPGNYAARSRITGGLEQIWKQRWIADFWNGHAGWVLEHRTRIMNFPPYFTNSMVGTGSYGDICYCDYVPERLLYPWSERNLNLECYWGAIAQNQISSKAPNRVMDGVNFYTPLGMSAEYYGLEENPKLLVENWQNFEIRYNTDIIQQYYGHTIEEFIQNVKRDYPDSDGLEGLKKYIDFQFVNK
ncbi:SusD/RagB family nutrient-binding outer membrane lipoprotein [Bacteroides sp. 1001136B_160425_E2]|uniref:SusD/RagB family nutrient-binding outer membrane lipoprotein n=1 Tax=Bacteroides sp. 1001136B_160425_E2 TaxID=2787083 RepID=UPI00189E8867|nr:SusD/RagB family nutrient-binding outer membrane lipoprotein [Bacteroides sp. 1001136B_160425_E2]